jgi:hypothetical protein
MGTGNQHLDKQDFHFFFMPIERPPEHDLFSVSSLDFVTNCTDQSCRQEHFDKDHLVAEVNTILIGLVESNNTFLGSLGIE